MVVVWSEVGCSYCCADLPHQRLGLLAHLAQGGVQLQALSQLNRLQLGPEVVGRYSRVRGDEIIVAVGLFIYREEEIATINKYRDIKERQ